MARVRVRYVGDVAVVRPCGTFIGDPEIGILHETLTNFVVEKREKTLLSMCDVQHLGRKAHAVILSMAETAGEHGSTFALCGQLHQLDPGEPSLHQILATVTVFDTEDEALRALGHTGDRDID